jgi:hypothetical protein
MSTPLECTWRGINSAAETIGRIECASSLTCDYRALSAARHDERVMTKGKCTSVYTIMTKVPPSFYFV